MRAKHTHYLILGDGLTGYDWPACVLSLTSRGRFPLAGEECRQEREVLAAMLEGGELAELLKSEWPIVVTSAIGGYVIEQV